MASKKQQDIHQANPKTATKKKTDLELILWEREQITAYKKGRLTARQIKKMETLNGQNWFDTFRNRYPNITDVPSQEPDPVQLQMKAEVDAYKPSKFIGGDTVWLVGFFNLKLNLADPNLASDIYRQSLQQMKNILSEVLEEFSELKEEFGAVDEDDATEEEAEEIEKLRNMANQLCEACNIHEPMTGDDILMHAERYLANLSK